MKTNFKETNKFYKRKYDERVKEEKAFRKRLLDRLTDATGGKKIIIK